MCSFLESIVSFDDSSLNKVFLDPDPILQNIESFWEHEEPYKAVREWHASNESPVDFETFKSSLRTMQSLDLKKRKLHPALQLRDAVMKRALSFREKALPHVYSYLPKNTPSIDVTVDLVAFVEPIAFTRSGKIVLNLSHTYWRDKSIGFLLNILVHELYHFGFYHNQKRFEPDPKKSKDQLVEHILWWLQNEGIATYVSYMGQRLFPFSFDVPDYRMIENATDLTRLSQSVNGILIRCADESYENLVDVIWSKGVRERAFYVVGAYMAKTIVEERGKKALTETLGKPVRLFAETFNNLTTKDFKISI
jgi:hypothetical protein